MNRIDETGTTTQELVDRVGYHVVRILNGAQLVDHYECRDDVGLVVYGSRQFLVKQEHLDLLRRVAKQIERGYIKMEGVQRPFGVNEIVDIIEQAKEMAEIQMEVEPQYVRVLFLTGPQSACAHYRIRQPCVWLNKQRERGEGIVWAEIARHLNPRLGAYYDVIVAPRVSDDTFVSLLQRIQAGGVSVVYETDDLLSQIPSWNPNRQNITRSGEAVRGFLANMADAVFVTTPQLRDELQYGEKTFVLRNAIDLELWKPAHRVVDRYGVVTIMWQGSATHDGDLRLVSSALHKVLKARRRAVKMLFWGQAPAEFVTFKQIGIGQAVLRPRPDIEDRVQLIDGVAMEQFPSSYCEMNVDIAIAPLVDNAFNRCKSELKVIEGWAAGAAVVASAVAPYERAIDHGVNGLLCRSRDDWVRSLLRLIDSSDDRKRLASAGKDKLKLAYLIEDVSLDYERALLSICRDKVQRPEALSNIERRLGELEGDHDFGVKE